MKIMLDSSFWVAIFLGNDTNHQKAIDITTHINLTSYDIILNNFVVEETTTILTYKSSKHTALKFLNALNGIDVLYSSSSLQEYIAYFHSIDDKISFADTSMIYDALKYNCTLLTFDNQQEKIFKKRNI